MIDGFEALEALSKRRTMTSTANLLGITQSAVSKRIAQLENVLGKELIEPSGRNVVLTPYAQRLLLRVSPLLSELKQMIQEESPRLAGTITLGAARALLVSWGAKTLGRVRSSCPDIELDISVRGSPGVIDQVLSGDCVAGIVRGTGESAPELVAVPLLNEPMVIVPAMLKTFRFPRKGHLDLISMLPNLESQKIIERRLKRLLKNTGVSAEVVERFQSSAVTTQLARSGFGHGLVPLGTTQSLGIRKSQIVQFPKPGLSVPASFVCRPKTLERPLIQNFLKSLKREAAKVFPEEPSS